LRIPTAPTIESLNSAVAAGILLYQLFGSKPPQTKGMTSGRAGQRAREGRR